MKIYHRFYRNGNTDASSVIGRAGGAVAGRAGGESEGSTATKSLEG